MGDFLYVSLLSGMVMTDELEDVHLMDEEFFNVEVQNGINREE